MKLGKHPKRIDVRTLQFKNYLLSTLPAPPATANWTTPVAAWPMMLNDSEGDCTCAGAGHLIEAWTANASTVNVLPDSAIQAAYLAVTNGADADTGADMLTVLTYWRNTGIGGDLISAFAEISLQNQLELQQAVSIFGGAYLGLALPDSVVQGNLLTNPWDDSVTDPPNQNNGHCVAIVEYDSVNVTIVTWGVLKTMTWGFYNRYADECYAILDKDWIKSTGNAPSGFDWIALQTDLSQINTGSTTSTSSTVLQDLEEFFTWIKNALHI
jgi:hypothetical protein